MCTRIGGICPYGFRNFGIVAPSSKNQKRYKMVYPTNEDEEEKNLCTQIEQLIGQFEDIDNERRQLFLHPALQQAFDQNNNNRQPEVVALQQIFNQDRQMVQQQQDNPQLAYGGRMRDLFLRIKQLPLEQRVPGLRDMLQKLHTTIILCSRKRDLMRRDIDMIQQRLQQNNQQQQ